jgi:hypothetical protein
MDEWEGEPHSPASLHRYLYAGADPVNKLDPTGLLFVSNFAYGKFVHNYIGSDFKFKTGGFSGQAINTILGLLW